MVMRRKRASVVVTAAMALACALGLGGCSLFTPSLADGDLSGTVQKTSVESSALISEGTLTVALDTSNAPMGMTGSDGSVTGYEADVARCLAQHFGLSVTFVDATSADNALTNVSADLYIGATSKEGTTKIQVFGDVVEDATAVFGKDGSTITADTLASSTVAVQAASASEDALSRAGINATEKTYTNVNECFAALESGEVQYVVCDMSAGAYLARAYSDVSFVDTISASTTYGIAVRAKNSELLQKVQQVLNSINSDGTLEAIHTMWFGRTPTSSLDSYMLSGVSIAQDADGENINSDDVETMTTTDTSTATSAAETPITNDINEVNN